LPRPLALAQPEPPPSTGTHDAPTDDAIDAETTGATATDEPGAIADPDPNRAAYDAFVASALRAFGVGRFREAADDFRAAYGLRPSARALRGLGKALYELGDYVGASEALERALVATVDPLGAALTEDVETLLVRSERQLATLAITTSVDAELVVDGRSVEAGVVRVNAGTVQVDATAPGHHPLRRDVRIEAGERVELTLTLERRAEPVVVTSQRSLLPAVGGTLAAVGLGGVIGGAFWRADRHDARTTCREREGVVCTNADRLRVEERAALATTVVAAVATAVGVGLLVGGLLGREEPTDAVACAPVRGGGLCAWEGRF
ncbi:MAG: hypothetical protein KC586_06710, partial [Myxococcales bacterium]|nr:hypothetical protein [Myxococcales bacterium]